MPSSAPSNSSAGGGVGLAGATFLVFLTLKLTGIINWSWWWVTAPLWGVTALVVLIVLGVVIAAVWSMRGDSGIPR